jgi:thymidylate synthase
MSIENQYLNLLKDILDNGISKSDRTGTGTISVFGRQIRHKMSEGFPLLTTKKMHWNSIVTELLWFLRGDTNIKFLLDYDCHIWTGDAYKRYVDAHKKEWSDKMTSEQLDNSCPNVNEFEKLIKTVPEFAKQWGELGPIYGAQWRKWTTYEIDMPGFDAHFNETQIDQIQNLIDELKTNPDSRRLMVSAWNVSELHKMVLPPCHYGFQVYTRELSESERINLCLELRPESKFAAHVETNETLMDDWNIPKRAISLMWNQRSVDTFLGLPFNIASYGLLLEIIAKEVDMMPDELIGNLGDTHLYLNHIEQAKEQISRTPYELPTIQITERNWYMHEAVKKHLGEKTFNEKIMSYRPECFELKNYKSHSKIKAKLSN